MTTTPPPPLHTGTGSADVPYVLDFAGAQVAAAVELSDALTRAAQALATDPRDWAANPTDAWTYGMLCGWECEEHDPHIDHVAGDPGCSNALHEVAEQHGWTARDVNLLRRARAAVRSAMPQAPRHARPEG